MRNKILIDRKERLVKKRWMESGSLVNIQGSWWNGLGLIFTQSL